MKKSQRVYLASVKDILEESGFQRRLVQGSRHIKLVVMTPNGERTHPVPGSPSDHRALRNFVSQVRAMLAS